MLQTRKPITDEAIKAMAERNEHRRQITKRVMGAKYISHPANHVLSDRQRATRIPLDDVSTAFSNPLSDFKRMMFTLLRG